MRRLSTGLEEVSLQSEVKAEILSEEREHLGLRAWRHVPKESKLNRFSSATGDLLADLPDSPSFNSSISHNFTLLLVFAC